MLFISELIDNQIRNLVWKLSQFDSLSKDLSTVLWFKHCYSPSPFVRRSVYSSLEGIANDFREKQRVLRTYLLDPSTFEPRRLLVDDMLLSTSHSSSRNVVNVSESHSKLRTFCKETKFLTLHSRNLFNQYVDILSCYSKR